MFRFTLCMLLLAAPAAAIGADVESLAHVENEHVMVRQKNILALTFHPELSHDPRVHALFLGMLRL